MSSQTQNNDKKKRDIGRKIKIVHPFHPENGKEYEYLQRIQTKKDDRIRCVDENGKVRFFQTKITDIYEAEKYGGEMLGKCVLRVEDLLMVKRLIEKVNKKPEE